MVLKSIYKFTIAVVVQNKPGMNEIETRAKKKDNLKPENGGARKRQENSGGGARMKKEPKAFKCKGYFKTKSRAQRQARSS